VVRQGRGAVRQGRGAARQGRGVVGTRCSRDEVQLVISLVGVSNLCSPLCVHNSVHWAARGVRLQLSPKVVFYRT